MAGALALASSRAINSYGIGTRRVTTDVTRHLHYLLRSLQGPVSGTVTTEGLVHEVNVKLIFCFSSISLLDVLWLISYKSSRGITTEVLRLLLFLPSSPALLSVQTLEKEQSTESQDTFTQRESLLF